MKSFFVGGNLLRAKLIEDIAASKLKVGFIRISNCYSNQNPKLKQINKDFYSKGYKRVNLSHRKNYSKKRSFTSELIN